MPSFHYLHTHTVIKQLHYKIIIAFNMITHNATAFKFNLSAAPKNLLIIHNFIC